MPVGCTPFRDTVRNSKTRSVESPDYFHDDKVPVTWVIRCVALIDLQHVASNKKDLNCRTGKRGVSMAVWVLNIEQIIHFIDYGNMYTHRRLLYCSRLNMSWRWPHTVRGASDFSRSSDPSPASRSSCHVKTEHCYRQLIKHTWDHVCTYWKQFTELDAILQSL